jgi:thiamine-phosphate pyrophosphorylase
MLVTDRQRFAPPRSGEPLAPGEERVIAEVLDRGVGAVQLREKDLDGGPLLARARRIREICDRHGARLLVNGRVDVALACGADGVHLPGGGLPVDLARKLLPPGSLVGSSIHHHADLESAQGADYVIFGPLFETTSKPGYGPAQGTAGLAAVVAAAGMPVVGIGGITPENAPDVIAAGASGVAMMGAPLEEPGCLDGLAWPTLSPIFNRSG